MSKTVLIVGGIAALTLGAFIVFQPGYDASTGKVMYNPPSVAFSGFEARAPQHVYVPVPAAQPTPAPTAALAPAATPQPQTGSLLVVTGGHRPADEFIAEAKKRGIEFQQGQATDSDCFKVVVNGQPKLRCPNRWVHR